MNETVTLKSGIKIPAIGFGPGSLGYSPIMKRHCGWIKAHINYYLGRFYFNRKQEKRYIHSIANALRVGFRLLDYSITYGNLPLIKEAIDKSGVRREEIFITTRIGNSEQFKNNIRDRFFYNLESWGLSKIDLLQFHWPVTDKFLHTWEEMIRLREEGYVRVLGVANCHKHHLEELEKETGILPEINQFEVHPLFSQKDLIQYCKDKGITVEAYTPIARFDDRLVRLPLLKELEKKYNKDFIQVILRWHIQNGIIPVVRTLNPKHQASNIDIFDFTLSKEDMQKIDAININSRLRYDPDNCDFSIL